MINYILLILNLITSQTVLDRLFIMYEGFNQINDILESFVKDLYKMVKLKNFKSCSKFVRGGAKGFNFKI